MYQQLKSEIREIIEISNQCPDGLKEKCFELLLENFLSNNAKNTTVKTETTVPDSSPVVNDSKTQEELKANQPDNDINEEINMKDFHVKIKKFLSANGIDISVINDLYYKEDGKLMPLYDSLKSTKVAECQIRLALLTAFENSFTDPSYEMCFNGEVVRQRCQSMKCYDGGNFSANFKNSVVFFDGWPDKYDKSFNCSLSQEGKKELAKVLLDLAKGE